MNLLKVKIHNVMSHKDTEIDFTKDGIYAIVGDTGSGKSAIREAITYGLTGRTSRSEKIDELMTTGESEMSVYIEYSLGNTLHSIKRGRNKQGAFLELTPSEDNRATTTLTQENLESILGFDFNTLVHTSFLEQGESDAFSKLKPTDAKQMIINLLHLEVYNECLDEVKSNIKRYTLDKDKTSMELNILKSSMIETDLKSDDRIKELSSIIKERQSEVRDVELKLIESRKNKELHEVTLSKLQKLLEQSLKETGGKKTLILSIEKSLNNLLSLKTDEACPTCHTMLTVHNKDEAVKHLIAEKDKLVDELCVVEDKYNEVQEEYNKVYSKSKSVDNEIYDLKTKSTSNLRDIKECETELTQIKSRLNVIEVNKKKIEDKDKELQKFQDILNLFNPLLEVFGKNGISVYIIDKVLPEVELIANDILDTLTSGAFSVSLNTQKELTSGKLSESFDIQILNQGVARNYLLYSGGQRFLIDLAIRMSLSVILARRKNFTIETLLIDEGFSSLDAKYREITVNAIEGIYNKFNLRKMILITHAEEISENIDNIIRTEIKNGITTLIQQ